MYDEIYKILDKYNNSKQYVDRDFIKNVCKIVCDGLNLDEYVTDYDCDYSLKNHGNYNEITGIMLFNPIKKHNKDMKGFFPDLYHILYNNLVLEGIFHEFSHANILKIIFEKSKLPIDVNDLFLEHLLLLHIMEKSDQNNNKYHEEYYSKNHDMDPFEKYSNINSSKMFNEILNRYPKELMSYDTINTIMNLQHQRFIIEGYKFEGDLTNSPSFDYYKNMSNSSDLFPQLDNLDFFKNITLPYDIRITFGFVITSDEFKNLLTNHIDTIDKYQKLTKK